MAYTLYTNGVLEKDGFYIPIDEFNVDYREYVAWLALGNSPTSADASIYLAKKQDDKLSIEQIKTAYQVMIDRLAQIENPANAPPFTQAGYNQLLSAVRDLATYQKRIMKYLRALF